MAIAQIARTVSAIVEMPGRLLCFLADKELRPNTLGNFQFLSQPQIRLRQNAGLHTILAFGSFLPIGFRMPAS
jgi:hypothetical protein